MSQKVQASRTHNTYKSKIYFEIHILYKYHLCMKLLTFVLMTNLSAIFANLKNYVVPVCSVYRMLYYLQFIRKLESFCKIAS